MKLSISNSMDSSCETILQAFRLANRIAGIDFKRPSEGIEELLSVLMDDPMKTEN